jgi:molybdenum cofactor sulfurtransferase
MPNSFIEFSATKECISLRTGCMCNPGAAAALLGREEDMANLATGATHHDLEGVSGQEFGVVRISLGLASNFQDVWKVIRFAAGMGNHKIRQEQWDRWRESLYSASTANYHP